MRAFMKRVPLGDTVERVQGMSVEMVILSMCASDRNMLALFPNFFSEPIECPYYQGAV